MSNLGEGIREAASKEREVQLIKTMYNNNVSCEEIARVTEIKIEDVKKAVYGSDPVTV